jgi:antitoxin component YwqK of YwqJK toxin-antitoxin module
VKKLTLLASGVILGIAITLVLERGWLSGSDSAVVQERRDIDLSELFYRAGIAYAASTEPSRIDDEPFTGHGVQLYENGQIRLTGDFVDGRPNGEWELWHNNQTLWVMSSLTADGFFPEKDNCTLLVNDEGEICLENFGDLVRNNYARWHQNGQLAWEGTFKSGKVEGRHRRWHENGQLALEGTYQSDEQEGLTRGWHENGQLKWELTFQSGELEGLARNWHENGQLKSEWTFQSGEAEGLYRNWDENGDLQSEKTYRAGEIVNGEAAQQ